MHCTHTVGRASLFTNTTSRKRTFDWKYLTTPCSVDYLHKQEYIHMSIVASGGDADGRGSECRSLISDLWDGLLLLDGWQCLLGGGLPRVKVLLRGIVLWWFWDDLLGHNSRLSDVRWWQW